jgi:hypothetical protein
MSEGVGIASTRSIVAAPRTPDVGKAPTDVPGRWVGGAMGALASLVAAGVAAQLDIASSGRAGLDSWTRIGLLGIPIGFALGRYFLPYARSAGWRRALSAGLLLGSIAPPLGAIEILGGATLVPGVASGIGSVAPLVLLPIALPVSYFAIVMTLPAGIGWGLAVRLVPDQWFVRLRVPAPIERLGIRHVALLAIASAVIVALTGSGQTG